MNERNETTAVKSPEKREYAPLVAGPCPWWCELEPGHPYDSVRPDRPGGYPVGNRTHQAVADDVWVMQIEENGNGYIEIANPVFYDGGGDTTPADARSKAASLTRLANIFEELQSYTKQPTPEPTEVASIEWEGGYIYTGVVAGPIHGAGIEVQIEGLGGPDAAAGTMVLNEAATEALIVELGRQLALFGRVRRQLVTSAEVSV